MSDIKVTQEQVNKILANSKIDISTVFGKCTVVAVQLPSGFILVESSACVDPENYDAELGRQICMKRIEDQIWLLEGYYLQKYRSWNG